LALGDFFKKKGAARKKKTPERKRRERVRDKREKGTTEMGVKSERK